MENNVFFSVIIPTFNRADLLKRTIESFLKQSWRNFEIIVVDDGGFDNSKDVVRDFNDSRLFYYWKENAERGAARNYGASLARGKWLNFFDSDDLAYPNHLETAYNFINNSTSEVMVLHTSYDWLDIKTDYIIRKSILSGELNKRLLWTNCLSCNNVFVEKEIFGKYKFSEIRDLSGSEDWVLWLRLSAVFQIIGIPEVTSSIVQHDGRSMVLASGDNCYLRARTLRNELALDNAFNDKFSKKQIYKVFSEPILLASLHYALEGKKKKSITTFLEAASFSLTKIFSRRSLAIFKYLLIKW